MNHNDELRDLSVDLVNKAEEAVADSDLDDLGEAAGMVLVGDVYGMIVSQDIGHNAAPAADETTDPDLLAIDSLNPFIR